MVGPIEPSSDIRQAASVIWQLYVALREQGADEQQALYLTSQMARPTSGPAA